MKQGHHRCDPSTLENNFEWLTKWRENRIYDSVECIMGYRRNNDAAREEFVGDYSLPGIITEYQGLLFITRD